MGHSGRMASKLRPVAPRFIAAIIACWALALACAGRSEAQPRTPLGVYAHVSVTDAIIQNFGKEIQKSDCYALPSTVSAELVHTYLQQLYVSLLQKATSVWGSSDPVSGIEVGIPWCLIEPGDPNKGSTEDWQYIFDVFEAIQSDAALSNKTVQLDITPGFDTPSWLLKVIKTTPGMGSCDGLFSNRTVQSNGLFSNRTVQSNCGTVTFSNFPECAHVVDLVLPLPWNSLYIQAWQDFLKALSTELSTVSNKQALVSISIAGPSGASPEFILPSTSNKSYVNPNPAFDCQPGGFSEPTSIPADMMWTKLINNAQKGNGGDIFSNNPNYSMYPMQPSQVFVDYWNNAIDLYETIFSGITLVLTPDSGTDFPELELPVVPIQSVTIAGVDTATANGLWIVDCSSNMSISCGAKVEILAHFANEQTYVLNASNNAKSTYVGGMKSSTCTFPGNIDLPGVKLLASSNSFVGGAQFDHPVSLSAKDRREEGCPRAPAVRTRPPTTPSPTSSMRLKVKPIFRAL